MKGLTDKDIEGKWEERFTGKLRYQKRSHGFHTYTCVLQQEIEADFFDDGGCVVETNRWWQDVPCVAKEEE